MLNEPFTRFTHCTGTPTRTIQRTNRTSKLKRVGFRQYRANLYSINACSVLYALSCPCGRQPSVSPARSHNPRRDSPVPLHASLPDPPALTATHTPTTDTPTSRISSRSQNPICSACNTPPRQTGGHCDSFLVSRSAPFGQAGRFSAASRLPVGDCQHVWFHLLPRHADRTSYLRGGMSHPLFPCTYALARPRSRPSGV